MSLYRSLSRAPGLVKVVASDPGQVRYIRAWGKALRQSPVDSRLPWLPFRVVDRLEKHLTPDSAVFEFGGGGSTLWFASRAGLVKTVEHDPDWFPRLAEATADFPTVSVKHASSDNDYTEYVNEINGHPDDFFDVVVVDGRERVRCFMAAMTKVKPGGLIVLDDSQRARYARVFEEAAGWPSKTYRGLTPSKAIAGVTTVWEKPL